MSKPSHAACSFNIFKAGSRITVCHEFNHIIIYHLSDLKDHHHCTTVMRKCASFCFTFEDISLCVNDRAVTWEISLSRKNSHVQNYAGFVFKNVSSVQAFLSALPCFCPVFLASIFWEYRNSWRNELISCSSKYTTHYSALAVILPGGISVLLLVILPGDQQWHTLSTSQSRPGANSIPVGKKVLNKEEMEELCGLMCKLQSKARSKLYSGWQEGYEQRRDGGAVWSDV
jgi:hypothetical protein